jgi:hypothetical protein
MGEVRVMTTTAVKVPISAPGAKAPSAATRDLSDRQVHVLVAIAAAVLLTALVALALYGGPGFVPASTSFEDLTEAAFATLI